MGTYKDIGREGAIGDGYPAAHPQPGIASFQPLFPTGASDPIYPNRHKPFDPKMWDDHAMAGALAAQFVLSNSHTRMLLGDIIDKAMRVAYKPVVPPPWHKKPFRARDIGWADSGTATANTTTTLWSQRINGGEQAVIRWFGHDVSDVAGWSDLTFQFRVNGIPVSGPLGNIGIQIGQTEAPTELMILVPPDSTIDFSVVNGNATTSYDVYAFIYGWVWMLPTGAAGGNAQQHASIA